MPMSPSFPTQVPAGSSVRRPETVVRFRPYAIYVQILFTLVFAASVLGFTVAAFFGARDVTIDASHGTSLLVVTRTYPLFGARRDSYGLAAIQGTGLRSRVTKNGVLTYGVMLRAGGEESISFAYAARGRQAQKQAIDAFLADPGAPPLHIPYDRGNPWAFLLCGFSLIMLWTLWTMWQSATVRFEWWRRAVVLERRRWPLPLWTRAFQVEELTGARVDERGPRRRRTYRVVLILRTGEGVPLLTGWGGGGIGPNQDAADRISAAIAKP
jgi:hypothetical protein